METVSAVLCWLCVLCCCSLVLVSTAPLPKPLASNFESPQQACGDQLANILSLVCTHGYNPLFSPIQSNKRRLRRQIVQECCYSSCSPKVLKLYCLADPTEPPSNVQIRKRSDSEVDSDEPDQRTEDVPKTSQDSVAEISGKQNSIFQTAQIDTLDSTTTKPNVIRKLDDSNKILNLLDSSRHNRKHKVRKNTNWSTQNETIEEEEERVEEHPNIPPLRHHKNHHHGRLLRARKSSVKPKRDNKITGVRSTPTFQIGTLKPYFSGRVLVSPRSNSLLS